MDDIELKKIEAKIDEIISDKLKSEDEDIRKKVKDLEQEIKNFKEGQVDDKVKEQIKMMYENGEISKKEFEQMIAEPGEEDYQ